MSITSDDIRSLQEERVRLGMPEGGPDRPAESNGRSLADRAGDEPESRLEHDEPEKLFPLGTITGDPKLTFGRLVKQGRPVEVTASLTAAEVPIREGKLLDPDKAIQVLVTVLPKQAVLVYKREADDDTVTGYKIRQPLKTAYVQTADDMLTVDQVEDLLRKALLLVGVTDGPKVAEIIDDVLNREGEAGED